MKSFNIYLFSFVLFLIMIGCKSQNLETSAPFEIGEKTYFYWVGGQKGTQGTTITLEGETTSSNISFSKVYFQNHEYDVVPQFNGNDFVIAATMSEFHKADRIMSGDPVAEYGNRPPQIPKKIPFDLKNDEAVILYSVNGQESYHKISEVKKLETIYRP